MQVTSDEDLQGVAEKAFGDGFENFVVYQYINDGWEKIEDSDIVDYNNTNMVIFYEDFIPEEDDIVVFLDSIHAEIVGSKHLH